MKLQQTTKTSTQQQTSKRSVDEYGYPLYLDAENDPALNKTFADVIDYYAALEAQSPKEAAFHSDQPWVDCPDAWSKQFVDVIDYQAKLKRPNPPTPEAVEKAQFIDKTYVWQGSAANKAAQS